MVGPGLTVNHGKFRALENTRSVPMAQERLLADLRESVKPLDRLKAERRVRTVLRSPSDRLEDVREPLARL